jgi:hypothetical protein
MDHSKKPSSGVFRLQIIDHQIDRENTSKSSTASQEITLPKKVPKIKYGELPLASR